MNKKVVVVFPGDCRISEGHTNAAIALTDALSSFVKNIVWVSPINDRFEDKISNINTLFNNDVTNVLKWVGFSKNTVYIFWGIDKFHRDLASKLKKLHIEYYFFSGGALNYVGIKHYIKKFVYLNFLTKYFNNSNGVVLTTSYELARFKKLMPLYKGKISQLYFTVSNTYNTIEATSIKNEITTLGFLGRLDINHKGLDILLASSALLINSGLQIKVELAGPNHNDDSNKLIELINNYGLCDHVKLVGPKYGNEKIAFLKNIDIFVHPSRWEAFGITIVEAMLAGVPVIVSNKCNISGDLKLCNASVVSSLDVDDLANNIRSLVENHQLRNEIAQNGKLWATENCSHEVTAKHAIEILNI